MYVYRRTSGEVFTVGYFSPDGRFCPEKDCLSREDAAAQVNYLNGGVDIRPASKLCDDLGYVLLDIHATLKRLLPEAKND